MQNRLFYIADRLSIEITLSIECDYAAKQYYLVLLTLVVFLRYCCV